MKTKIVIIDDKKDLKTQGIEKLLASSNKKKTGKNNLTFFIPKENEVFAKEKSEDFISRVVKELDASPNCETTLKVSFDTVRDLVQKGYMPLNIIKNGRVIRPDDMEFQRSEGTSNNWKSDVIISTLTAHFIPSLTGLLVSENGQYKIILLDGQQRAIAISKFMNGDFKLTGTKSGLDGLTYSDLRADYPELQMALNRCIASISIIDPIFSTNEKYRASLFERRNTTSILLTAMELNNSQHYTSEFLQTINAEIDNPGKNSNVRDIIFGKPTTSTSMAEIKVDRMREKMKLYYAFGCSVFDVDSENGGFSFTHKYLDASQQALLNSLFTDTQDSKVSKKYIKELRATTTFIAKNFGCNYAHNFLYDCDETVFMRMPHLASDACPITNYKKIARTDKVSAHHLYSLFALSYTLHKLIYKRAGEIGKREQEILASVTERVFASPEFLKASVSSSTSKIQKRNAIVIKTVLEQMLKYDAFQGANKVEKETMAAAIIEALAEKKLPSASIYDSNKNMEEVL